MFTLYWFRMVTSSSVASLTIKSRYANIFVFIDCENNQFLKKWIMIIIWNLHSGTKSSGWLRCWSRYQIFRMPGAIAHEVIIIWQNENFQYERFLEHAEVRNVSSCYRDNKNSVQCKRGLTMLRSRFHLTIWTRTYANFFLRKIQNLEGKNLTDFLTQTLIATIVKTLKCGTI